MRLHHEQAGRLAESFEYRDTDDGLAIVTDAAACLRKITGGKTLIESSRDAREGRETLVRVLLESRQSSATHGWNRQRGP